MIHTEQELRHSYTAVAKLLRVIESISKSDLGHEETRRDEIEGVEVMVRKIEREIGEYLLTHRDYMREPATERLDKAA